MAFDARRVLLPLAVLMTLLIGLLVLFEKSYMHLNDIGLQISRIQDRQRLLAQVVRTVNEAEAAQRAYLLSSDAAFLSVYDEVKGRANTYLESVERSYRDDGVPITAKVAQLKALTQRRLDQIQRGLDLYANSGRDAAVEHTVKGPGRQTMEQFRQHMQAQEDDEANHLVQEWERYLLDLKHTRIAMGGAMILNLLLLGLLGYLSFRALSRRARETERLQRQIDERTTELTALSNYLQQVSEREKQQLARELHDSLGGLLVATKMDLAWLRARLPTEDEDLLLRWRRIQKSLDQGVDLKRRVVEQLRPTLLDNMGLYSALRWQMQESCGRGGLNCIERLPEIEARLSSEASIALFRVAQESFTNILKHSGATTAELSVRLDANNLSMSICDNGSGLSADGKASSGQGMAGMRHRIQALGGTIQFLPREEGGTEVRVRVPLNAILQKEEDLESEHQN